MDDDDHDDEDYDLENDVANDTIHFQVLVSRG